MSAFIGANIITAQIFWEGTAGRQSSDLCLHCCYCAGQSMKFTVVGARCTSFCSYDLRTKTNYGIAGGVVFILAGLLCLIPVSCSAYTIITGFYNPLTADGRQGELGASIYVGWISGALLVIGGGMLCGTYRC
ncbi:hypothetical protein Q8A73_022554 [Channa argus]|nr:hypothetical protein Q8A73_022554 [Channa argus]